MDIFEDWVILSQSSLISRLKKHVEIVASVFNDVKIAGLRGHGISFLMT